MRSGSSNLRAKAIDQSSHAMLAGTSATTFETILYHSVQRILPLRNALELGCSIAH